MAAEVQRVHAARRVFRRQSLQLGAVMKRSHAEPVKEHELRIRVWVSATLKVTTVTSVLVISVPSVVDFAVVT